MSQSSVSGKVTEFFSTYPLHTYAKGQILLLSDEYDGSVYYLESGTVKVYDVTYRGDEIILNLYKQGAFFPMSLAVNGGNNPYIYEADTEITFRQAPAPAVVTFIREQPDVLYDLLSRVYKGIDGINGRLANLMSGTAKSRLIFELIIEAKRFGKTLGKTTLLQVNEKDLGARAGLSRETVSREIAKLKQDKLIVVQHNGLVINDIAALEAKLAQIH